MVDLVKLKRWREGAQVERAHTVRHIGDYSVGAHSHGVAIIILALHPAPSPNLIRAALLHDLHEVHTGDVPIFAKTEDFKRLEELVDRKIGTKVWLTSEERLWLRGADSLELLLWCREQQTMGNRNVDRIAESVEALFGPDSLFPAELVDTARGYSASRSWPVGAR